MRNKLFQTCRTKRNEFTRFIMFIIDSTDHRPTETLPAGGERNRVQRVLQLGLTGAQQTSAK